MAPTLTLYPRRVPEHAPDGGVWNWARNATLARPESLRSPRSEDELRQVVAETTGRLRLTGTRMSSGRMLALDGDDDVLVDTSGLRGLLGTTQDTATFAAGTSLQEIHDVLSATGRMLPSSPGVIASQTLGGAVSTGTHGQGLRQSSIADAATSIRLLLADGSVQDVGTDHPWFGAVQLGLGVLGAVTAVTLRTVPSVVYSCSKYAVGAGTIETDLLAWNSDHVMSKAWWFPEEDQVHVWTAREATQSEARAYLAGGEELITGAVTSDAMNGTVDQTLTRMRDHTGLVDADAKPFRTVTRFRDFTDVTGDVYQVFCRGIATPQINVEIGVPLERAAEALQRLKHWYARSRPHLHYPVILRCTGPSTAWLSPSSGQETCFFGFVVYYGQDGSLSPEGLDVLREVEQVLAATGGRPHWGKYFDESSYDWPTLFPRWDDFRGVRDALDPQRRFGNAFTARLLD